MPKAVIFDVDGTLVDSVDIHARAWVEAFHEFGHDIEFQDIRRQIGKGGDQLMPVFLDKQELDRNAKGLDARRGEILKQRYLSTIKPFAEIRALFERIRSGGARIVLASSARSDELQTHKKRADIEDLVDAETTSDESEASKPHPDIFQAALAKLDGLDPADVIVIGDTPYDAEAAAKAGLRTIGVLCGGFPEPDLRQAGCIAIYRDPAHLLAEFDSSPLTPS